MPNQSASSASRTPKWPVYYFGSGMKLKQRLLSNFTQCNLVLVRSDFPEAVLKRFPVLAVRLAEGPIRFRSTEAAWQAIKANSTTVFKRFESAGDIGGALSQETFLPFVPKASTKGTPQELALNKFRYWMDRNCVGIVPKMATNAKYANALGFKPGDLWREREYLPEDIEEGVWLPLLRAKIAQNEHIRAELIANLESQFVEYSRMAEHAEISGAKVEYWGGSVNSDGRLFGRNRMGELIQKIALEEMLDK